MISRSLVQLPAGALWSVFGQDSLFHIASVYPAAKWVPSINKAELVRYMLPVAVEYPPGDWNGFRVYRPARGGRLCERFGGYKTINRIPLPLPLEVSWFWSKELILQASTLTQNFTSPVGLVTPRIHWSCQFFTGHTNLSLTYQEKILYKIHPKHLFLFTLSSFVSKAFGDILEGKPVNKNLLALLVCCFEEFHWPGASGSLLALSPSCPWIHLSIAK